MTLEARLREEYRYPSVVALNGREFIKSEFRPVPPTREAEAGRTTFLEVREIALGAELPPDELAAAPEDAGDLLASNVGIISDAVAIMDDPKELSDLATEERKGQNRKGVARAIDARMLEIAEEGLDEEEGAEEPEAPATDLSILEGNVGAVSGAVAEMDDLEELAALAAAEAEGGNRVGVSKAIEARLIELSEEA